MISMNQKEITKQAAKLWASKSPEAQKNIYSTYTGIKTCHVDLEGITFSMLPKYVKMAMIDEVLEN